jgi:protocadherin-15
MLYCVAEVSQSTSPAELPIVGDPFRDVTLDLVFPKDKSVFILNGKKLQLLEPLDRDEDNLSHIVFQVSTDCNFWTWKYFR